MKKSEIQSKTKERLRALNIIGIDNDLLRKAKEEIDNDEDTRVSLKSIPSKDIPHEDTPEKGDVRIMSNFCKVDCDVLDKALPQMDVYEQAIYVRLFRLSYGYDRNWCTVGYNALAEACGIKRTGIVNAVKRLLEKGWLKVIEFDHAIGTTYRVYLPLELGIDSKTTVKAKGVSPESIPLKNISSGSILLENTDGVSSESIPQKNTRTDKPLPAEENTDGVSLKSIPLENTTIDRSFKIDLSLAETVDLFYNGIGQTTLTKKKREKAEKNIEELLEDGFSQQDIIFAINWTIKNAKEKPYDFALIKDTIGQAIATKKEMKAEEQKNAEIEQKRAKQMEDEKKLKEERKRMESYKESLSPEQRAELRERALDEIKNMGNVRQELIGQPLIEAKENEILRKDLGTDK